MYIFRTIRRVPVETAYEHLAISVIPGKASNERTQARARTRRLKLKRTWKKSKDDQVLAFGYLEQAKDHNKENGKDDTTGFACSASLA